MGMPDMKLTEDDYTELESFSDYLEGFLKEAGNQRYTVEDFESLFDDLEVKVSTVKEYFENRVQAVNNCWERDAIAHATSM